VLSTLLPWRAWRRSALEVYVGPELGFCGNCETGEMRHVEGIAVSQKCDLVIAVIADNLLDERERTAAYRLLPVGDRPGPAEPTARGALTAQAASAHGPASPASVS
jgi:hypothetical protein